MSFKFSDGTASEKEALQLTTKTKTCDPSNAEFYCLVMELFAKEIGEDKARRYLKQIDYGNADPSTSNGDYWIDGNLYRGTEQIAFSQEALS